MVMNRIFLVVLLGSAVVGGGCGKSSEPTVAPIAISDPGEPTQAQPRLQTMKVYVGSQEVIAELALTAQQQRTGMMFRTNLEETAGMLFPLASTQRASFWMNHCPLPLSAAYIDPEGIIQEIHELEANNTNSVVAASDNIRFVLEMPQGWFKRHQIREGVAVATERGPLLQTFFGKQ